MLSLLLMLLATSSCFGSFYQAPVAGGSATILAQITGSTTGFGDYFMGQSFKPTSTGTANTITISLLDGNGGGTYSGTVLVKIYANGSSQPGTVLATSDTLSITNLPLTATQYTFTFSSPPTLTSGTLYWWAVDTTGLSAPEGNINALANSANPYANGNSIYGPNESSWTTAGVAAWDLVFELDQSGSAGPRNIWTRPMNY